MTTLYHGATSACSVKVRPVLAETGLGRESRMRDLGAGDPSDPQYLKLNPNSVVPETIMTNAAEAR
jgi:glutathione S-transferase